MLFIISTMKKDYDTKKVPIWTGCPLPRGVHPLQLHLWMCVYCNVEDYLSVCLKTPSCIPKKQKRYWNFAFAFEQLWPRTLESTLPFNVPFRNSWETTQLSKMLCDDASLTDQQFGHNIVSPKFPAALSFLNLLEAPSLFGEYFFLLWF